MFLATFHGFLDTAAFIAFGLVLFIGVTAGNGNRDHR